MVRIRHRAHDMHCLAAFHVADSVYAFLIEDYDFHRLIDCILRY
jgi:hypothetical protein